MKKELIKTDNYLLVVDDSEIKVNDWVYNVYDGIVRVEHKYQLSNIIVYGKDYQKIISHLPLNNSPILEGVLLLPPLEEGMFTFPTHFEFEMKTTWARNTDRNVPTKDDLDYEIKTTTNSQGQEVACGKYIFEP